MHKFIRLTVLALSALTLPPAFGQGAPPALDHAGHDMGQMGHDHGAMGGMKMGDAGGAGRGMGMSSSVDLLDPMSQEASGTAWLPSSTPMYGKMTMFGRDMLMLHGDVHARYIDVGSDRGDRRFDAPNWFMGMYSHPLSAKEQLGFRLMMSLDPLTEHGFGYPLLFQTGESWRNQPLHDRQHPHDLFDEVSATYSRRLGGNRSASLYLAYPGEPALGPPTFMHRLIAYDLADAPIGHHWQDATHITFGVATAGLNFGSRVKAEGSVFTGREPDENRYNFDTGRFDSYSGRLSYNPNPNHSFQISNGYLKNPEGDGADMRRTTASWIYNKPLGEDANFTTSLVWGQNDLQGEGKTNSYLAEAHYQKGRDTLFARVENLTKSGHELVLPEALHGEKFNLGAYTVGYVRDLKHGKGIDTGVGAALTTYSKPSSLNAFYGSGTPVSFQVFFRFRPSRMGGHSQIAAMNGGDTMVDMAEEGTVQVEATFSTDPPKAREKSTLTVRLTDKDGQPITGAKVTSSVEMTSMKMGVEHPAFKEIGEGRYQGDVTFSMAGPWRVTLNASLPGGKRARKSLDFAVAE